MSEEERHIRNERATREAYPTRSEENLRELCIAWCGENASNQWHFESTDHVLLSLKRSTCITPCRKCLTEIRSIIDRELS